MSAFPSFPSPRVMGTPEAATPRGSASGCDPTSPPDRGTVARGAELLEVLLGAQPFTWKSQQLSLKNIFIHLPKFSRIFCFWNFQSSMCFWIFWCIRIQTDDSLDENSGAELWFQWGWEFWGPQSNGRILSNFSDSSECQIWERGAGDSRVRLRQGLRNSTIHFIWFHYHPL